MKKELLILLFCIFLTILPKPVYAQGVLDQSVEPTDGYYSSISYKPPNGQSFTPSLSVLVAVEVYVDASYGWDSELTTITLTVNIREGDIYGNILATDSATVDVGFFGWVLFSFSYTAVVPGNLYVIELKADIGNAGWFTRSEVYPGGTAIFDGAPDSSWDHAFRTHGSVSTPTLQLSALTPHVTELEDITLIATLTDSADNPIANRPIEILRVTPPASEILSTVYTNSSGMAVFIFQDTLGYHNYQARFLGDAAYLERYSPTVGVDVEARVPPVEPFWTQWWVWAIIGGVVIASAVIILKIRKKPKPIIIAPPETKPV